MKYTVKRFGVTIQLDIRPGDILSSPAGEAT
jgi:hypothetical protein